MTIKGVLKGIFGFNYLSFSVLTCLVYLAIAITVGYQDVPHSPPKRNVQLDTAWKDLQVIAALPHPYNSHRNDVVHDYIFQRMRSIGALNPEHTSVEEDLVSNATWSQGPGAIYHEGLNILAKVEGTEPDLPLVLFSAHFDSVSTAPGATDDGMGVATTIQIFEHLVQNRPRRTAIFNINNGEEDGLNGAHVFLEHPWVSSKTIETFLNLEGAGSGGRALLFRSSNARVTRAFRGVPHPHGNTISADGFKKGFIRSGTDYSVYEKFGMRGLDLAFYRHRSKYHTRYDGVPNLEGQDALWSMLEASLATAQALVDEKATVSDDTPALYFDVLGEGFAVLTLRTVFIINIVFLVVGPILALFLAILASRENKLFWTWRGWLRFPIGLTIATAATAAVGLAHVKFNPFIIYGSTYTVILSLASTFFLTLALSLRASTWLKPVPLQRHIILIETYLIWWGLLVIDTIYVNIHQIGSMFPINFFHAGAIAALLVGLVEIIFLKPKVDPSTLQADLDDPNVETEITVERDNDVEGEADSATEHTPLLVTRRKLIGLKSEMRDEKQIAGMWILQYLLAVVFPALLAAQLALFLLSGLSQTLSDGAKPITIYLAAIVFAILIVLPLGPFIFKAHSSLLILVLLLFLSATAYNIFAFPFSSSDPLKVFFKQTLDLDTHSNSVILEGVPRYLRRPIVASLPSATTGDVVWCSDKETVRPFLRSCRWPGLDPNVANGAKYNSLISLTTKRLNTTNAAITLSGKDTRACRIYFEYQGDDVSTLSLMVRGASSGGKYQEGYEPDATVGGLKQIRLWGRKFGQTFTVDVGGLKEGKTISGRVACEWSEMGQDKIPALAEVVAFLPTWAAATKADDGLVEAFKKFQV